MNQWKNALYFEAKVLNLGAALGFAIQMKMNHYCHHNMLVEIIKEVKKLIQLLHGNAGNLDRTWPFTCW